LIPDIYGSVWGGVISLDTRSVDLTVSNGGQSSTYSRTSEPGALGALSDDVGTYLSINFYLKVSDDAGTDKAIITTLDSSFATVSTVEIELNYNSSEEKFVGVSEDGSTNYVLMNPQALGEADF